MAIDLNNLETIQDSIVTVMGLGRFKQGSGVGATKWLMRHGAQLVITDLKTEEELRESVDDVMDWYTKYRKEFPDREIYSPVFVLGEHHENDFEEVDMVVQNPGVPRESEFVQLAAKNGISIESDVSLFFRLCPFPIYTVTGTRGKSTTTALWGEMLKTIHEKTVVAGNIGHSPLEDLDWILKETEPVPVVLELSSWLLESLENIDKGPKIAALTNVYKDHLDRYESYKAYIAAKELMFKFQKEDDIAIINKDQDTTRDAASRVHSKVYWFSLEPLAEDEQGAYIEDGKMILSIDGIKTQLCTTEEFALFGKHNFQNALAAIIGAHFAGVPHTNIAKVLKTFQGLPHRQETVREANGVMFVNDTTATSPEGVMAALDRFNKDKNIVLIAGGSSKGFSYDKMADEITKTCKQVILIDHEKYDATDAIAKAIGSRVPIKLVETMSDAVQSANAVAVRDDIILLSPGAASFGPFKNEFERGAAFVDEVKKIPGEI